MDARADRRGHRARCRARGAHREGLTAADAPRARAAPTPGTARPIRGDQVSRGDTWGIVAAFWAAGIAFGLALARMAARSNERDERMNERWLAEQRRRQR